MEETTELNVNKDVIGVLLDKISRKGRLIFIGIAAVVYIKRPEAITYASVAVYTIPVIAVTFLASLGTLSQHRLDMVTKVGKDGYIDLVKSKRKEKTPITVYNYNDILDDEQNRIPDGSVDSTSSPQAGSPLEKPYNPDLPEKQGEL